VRRTGLIALVTLVAGCGPHYLVWPDAQPTAAGFVAARRDVDGAVVAVQPGALRHEAVREDGASLLGRRVTRPKRFRTGVALFAAGVPLVVVSLIFGLGALGQNTHDGDINRGIAVGFGTVGGAAMLTGVGLFSWAWPPPPGDEPITAHPELVAAPPPP
jgi:hypothetical protein